MAGSSRWTGRAISRSGASTVRDQKPVITGNEGKNCFDGVKVKERGLANKPTSSTDQHRQHADDLFNYLIANEFNQEIIVMAKPFLASILIGVPELLADWLFLN